MAAINEYIRSAASRGFSRRQIIHALRRAGYSGSQIHDVFHPHESFLLFFVFLGVLSLHTFAAWLVIGAGVFFGEYFAVPLAAVFAVLSGYLSVVLLKDVEVSEWFDAVVGVFGPAHGVFLMLFSFSALDVLFDFASKLLTAGAFAPAFALAVRAPPAPVLTGVLYYVLANVWIFPHLLASNEKKTLWLYLAVPLIIVLSVFLGSLFGDFIVGSF